MRRRCETQRRRRRSFATERWWWERQRGGRGGRGGRDAVGWQRCEETGTTSANRCGVDARVVSALLTDINRAFLRQRRSGRSHRSHLPRSSRSRASLSGRCLQAMMLLFQLLSARSSVSDRYTGPMRCCSILDWRDRRTPARVLSLIYKSLRERRPELRSHGEATSAGNLTSARHVRVRRAHVGE